MNSQIFITTNKNIETIMLVTQIRLSNMCELIQSEFNYYMTSRFQISEIILISDCDALQMILNLKVKDEIIVIL